MKKLALSLALIGAVAFGATAASAAEIKATGTWQIDANLRNNQDFTDTKKDNSFDVEQRIRTAFQFIANENLKGVLETQIGTNSWGNGQYSIGAGRTANQTATGANSAGNGNLILRKAYLDFKVPDTKVNILAGYQSISLPSAFGGGSAILDDHMAGIAAVVPVTDGMNVVAGYARPYDANTSGSNSSAGVRGSGSALDAAFLYGDLNFTGFKVQPFLAYGYAGANAIEHYAKDKAANSTYPALGITTPDGGYPVDGVRAYWAGAAFTMTALDPFKVMADVNYGRATFNGSDSGRSGWLADLAVDYTGLSMVTPELFFAYSSGENSDGKKSERMPVLSGENWAYGTFWMQGGDSLTANTTMPQNNLGFWALGLSFKDIKLIDKLSHTVNFIYFKGTNDESVAAGLNTNDGYGNVLTKKDHLFEVDLNSKYQLYDELSLGLELSYINASFDKDVWHNAGVAGDRDDLSKDAYKATLMMRYTF